MAIKRKVVFALMISALFLFAGCAVAEEVDMMTWLKGPEAPKKAVAVFIETGMTRPENDKKVREVTEERLEEFLPPDKFTALPLNKTVQALTDYKEDNRIIVSESFAGLASREDILKVCAGLGEVDYAFLIHVSQSIPKAKARGLGGAKFTAIVTCDMRLLDIETGEYISRAKAEKTGTSTTVSMLVGAPSADKAFNSALLKALDEIKLDTSMVQLEQPE